MVGAGVGLVYDERMCAHANLDDPFHPEKPTRITAIYKSLDSAGVVGRCTRVEARDATPAELASVHTEEHIVRMCGVSSKKYGQGKRAAMARRYNSIYFNEGSSSSALLAAGSVVEVCLRVARGHLRAGAAVVRPPGHHAEEGTPMGFCLFNNVAVAAHVLVHGNPDLGVRKVLIVDWDVHHGNGTQHMFWRDPQVLYFSIHRHDFGDFYPGGDDGDYDKVGEGSGAGFNINVPWPHNGFGDLDYLAVFDHILMPVAQEFNPDLVLVSGGFDSAMGDPLGGCEVTPAGYSQMTKRLMGLANGRIVLALEGGYNLKSISDSYLSCMKVLLGEQPEKILGTKHHRSLTIPLVQQVRSELEQYWLVLSAKVDDKEIINLTREVDGISGEFAIADADLPQEPNREVAELESSALMPVPMSRSRTMSDLTELMQSFNKDIALAINPDNNKFTTGSSVDSSHLAKRDGVQKQLTNLEGEQAAGLGDVSSPLEGSEDAIVSNQHQEDDSDHKQILTQNNLGCKLSSADGGVYENHGVGVTVSEDGGLADGDKCKVPGLADSLILSPDQNNPETTYVWYACYASNMWAARFMCYIKGGQVEGLTRCCIGARNQAPPVASRWVVVPYRLFFGRSSRSWGSGGVAFLDPISHGGAPTTQMRLYKITLQQFCDILTQENDEDPKRSQLLIEWNQINKLRDVHSGISHSTIEFLEDTWYGTIKYLGDEDGLPILTITCSLNDMQKFRDGKLQLHNPPSESYRMAILRGLLEQGIWSEKECKAYIESNIRAS